MTITETQLKAAATALGLVPEDPETGSLEADIIQAILRQTLPECSMPATIILSMHVSLGGVRTLTMRGTGIDTDEYHELVDHYWPERVRTGRSG